MSVRLSRNCGTVPHSQAAIRLDARSSMISPGSSFRDDALKCHPRGQLDAPADARQFVEGRTIFLVQNIVEVNAEAEFSALAERAAERKIERSPGWQAARSQHAAVHRCEFNSARRPHEQIGPHRGSARHSLPAQAEAAGHRGRIAVIGGPVWKSSRRRIHAPVA